MEAYNCVLDQVPCLGGEERVSSCTGTVEILGPAAGGTGGTGGAGAGNGGAGGAGGSSASGSGGAAGSAGSGPVCTPTKGAASAVLIDDFSDHDNLLAPVGGRTGSWFAFSDGSCTQLSPPYDSTGTLPVPISTVGRVSASDGSINTTATRCDGFGVGVGFSLLTDGLCPYDASSYSGFSYWAKGTGAVSMEIHTSIPEIVTGDADFYPPGRTLTDAWAQFSVPFASLQSFTGNTVFDPKTVLSISFVVSNAQGPVSLTLDDIAFDVP